MTRDLKLTITARSSKTSTSSTTVLQKGEKGGGGVLGGALGGAVGGDEGGGGGTNGGLEGGCPGGLGGGGGDGISRRHSQSGASVPRSHAENVDPSPPSSQEPSCANWHVSSHRVGGGNGGDIGPGGASGTGGDGGTNGDGGTLGLLTNVHIFVKDCSRAKRLSALNEFRIGGEDARASIVGSDRGELQLHTCLVKFCKQPLSTKLEVGRF